MSGLDYLVKLKEEFIDIGKSYINKKLTESTLESIKAEYYCLFSKYGLLDIKYKIIENEYGNIIIKPIREIDRLALYSILNEVKN